jgi:hypothetical protein
MWALATINSFSLDLTGLLSYAEDMFNGLAPALIPVVGISLGIAILMLVLKALKGAVH